MMHMHLDLGLQILLFVTLGYLLPVLAITWAILHFTRRGGQ